MKKIITVTILSIVLLFVFFDVRSFASAHSYALQMESNSLPDTTNRHQLLKKIRNSRSGFVRVIVRYDMAYDISDLKNTARKQMLQQNVSTMHSQFRNLVREQNVSGINESKFGPQVSLSVNEKSLKYLYTLPMIKSVREERYFFTNLDQSTSIVQADDSWEGFG